MPKPSWLNKKINITACRDLKRLLRSSRLHTVCEESFCPNISECFSCGVATFMILGNICTRYCSFCAVVSGEPASPDRDEPRRLKNVVEKLNLRHIVITSPTRDDLEDGGAAMFLEAIRETVSLPSVQTVEVLIPDFTGKTSSIEKIAFSGARVIGHNLETVPSLYIKVRTGASYARSLEVLRTIKPLNGKVFTKSGLMLGLGEKREEVLEVLRDLRAVGCDFLTLGQYLPPSRGSYPLKSYITPEEFAYFKRQALKLGFRAVKSGPYVRSSYLADSFLVP